jgi:predicted methyltransferase
MAMDELTMLSFVGIYFLLLGSFIYNFYLSKRMYRLLENIGEVLTLVVDSSKQDSGKKETEKEGVMKKLMREGMEMHHSAEEETEKPLLSKLTKQEQVKGK